MTICYILLINFNIGKSVQLINEKESQCLELQKELY